MSKVRLMLVDDHAVVRSGLRMLLEAQPDIEIVGEAGSGCEALDKIESLEPDIVLMDIGMPEMDGIETTRRLKEIAPDTAVLALTIYEDDRCFFGMLEAGASGYVPKRAAPEELLTAIYTLRRGEVFLPPSLSTRLVRSYLRQTEPEDESASSGELTPREEEVLILITEGLTNPEIGEKLGISAKTVDRHCENMMRKLKLHSRIDLVKYAIKKGLIELKD